MATRLFRPVVASVLVAWAPSFYTGYVKG